jgi:hypothetical protein
LAQGTGKGGQVTAVVTRLPKGAGSGGPKMIGKPMVGDGFNRGGGALKYARNNKVVVPELPGQNPASKLKVGNPVGADKLPRVEILAPSKAQTLRQVRGEWPNPTTAIHSEAARVREQFNIPEHMLAGRHHYLAEEMKDHQLIALAEAEQREFAVVTFTHNGVTRRILTAGTAGDVPVVGREGLRQMYPGARIDRVVHTHPPGSRASLEDLFYARTDATLDILMRNEAGSLRVERWTPFAASRELRYRGYDVNAMP